MRARILLRALTAGGIVFCAGAQPPPDLLQRVRRKVLDTVERLPRYMCTQTVDRKQFEPNPGHPAPPCEPGAHKRQTLTVSDRLRLDVAVSARGEMYSWVGESRFDDRGLFSLVGSGALSTGGFSTYLALVFRDDNSAFTYTGVVHEGGRALDRFEFHVPRAASHYYYSGAGHRVITGYSGDILVDPVTADLIRLEVHSESLPSETGSCQSDTTLEYTHERINDSDFLLPRRSELYILDANGSEMRNTTVYAGCREFLGQSTVHFESAPDAGNAPNAQAGVAEWSPGLPFTIAINDPIDPAKAAAGDRFAARLTATLKDAKGHVLAPRNAAIRVRMLQVRRFYSPAEAFRLSMRLETITIDGAARPLAAEPDTSPPPVLPTRNRTALERRTLPVEADNQDRSAAVFTFSMPRGSTTIPAGFESRWFTAREP